jgi:hypothetical protein
MREGNRETALEWLKITSLEAEDKRVRAAATHNISEWHRLVKARPESAHGGWTLWERLWGKTRLSVLGPLAVGIDDGAMSTVSYEGETYTFYVFAEAFERAGKIPPAGALRAGIVPLGLSIPTHRKIKTKGPVAPVGTLF